MYRRHNRYNILQTTMANKYCSRLCTRTCSSLSAPYTSKSLWSAGRGGRSRLSNPNIWEFAPVDILGYLRIWKDMKGYLGISLEIQDIILHHILKMISQIDIPRYPYISNRYPTTIMISQNDILQCYPDYILIYPYLSFLNIPYISSHISMNDVQRIS